MERKLSELLNNKLRVNFVLSKEIVRKENTNDTFIKNALETFNGRVIKEG